MKRKFRKVDIVRAGSTTILVTGPGNKNTNYRSFSGVILKEEAIVWSDSAFEKVKLKIVLQ